MEIFRKENLNINDNEVSLILDYSAPIKPIKSNPSDIFELISAIEIK
jgi:hypothetical protein